MNERVHEGAKTYWICPRGGFAEAFAIALENVTAKVEAIAGKGQTPGVSGREAGKRNEKRPTVMVGLGALGAPEAFGGLSIISV